MKLTTEQQRVVEQNMGLVGKVIKDKVHDVGHLGMFTYEDLFQIGCIGLCKAAATDKGGCFSTYAYRIIWNEICDALIQATRIHTREEPALQTEAVTQNAVSVQDLLEHAELRSVLDGISNNAPTVVAKGIQCLILSQNGYSSKELGRMYSANHAAIRMWMTKARRYLRGHPELVDYRKELF